MTKLEKLYSIIRNSEELGIELGADTLRQTEELEEQIIKDEILPVVEDKIEPALMQVQRELVLVVDYKPGETIRVSLSRKKNITELLDAKLLEMDPQAVHKEGKKHEKPAEQKNSKTILRVTFPDGSVIADKKAKITFAETIKRIGAMRVRALGMAFCRVPLVSNTLDQKYGNTQVAIGNGLYVMTHSSTHDKKKQLDSISQQLGLNLIVEEI